MADATDKMREALKCLLALHDNRVDTAEAWNKSMEEAREALTQQPAQGEAVAEFRKNRSGSYVHWFINESSLPASTMLYTAPPAPSASVPDAIPVPHDTDHGDRCYRNGWNACRAAMLASGGKASVPEGWKLVPVEPTPGMALAGVYAAVAVNGRGPWFPACYEAMLAAAPEPPR